MKYILNLVLVLCFISCTNTQENNSTKEKEVLSQNKEQQITGDFLFHNNSGIIQIGNEIHAVAINDKTKELIEACKKVQKTPFDMVAVTVSGSLTKNPKEGWAQVLNISDIVSVAKEVKKDEIIEIK